ncbi:MAG TPA: AraC family transcriptional regulator [Gammaproteobacteria bacterium]|nr:AraC family transcriptional regulator [Gammaproteobacteria bacterium]
MITPPIERDILHLLRQLRGRHAANISLEALARRAGWSPFHLHRAFRRVVRETPKQHTQRVRLDRAAARLAATRDSVLRVALGAGFASHEVFTRAFRRRFGCSPSEYRAVALHGATPLERTRHAELVEATSPCVGLYHVDSVTQRSTAMPMLSIAREELVSQPILFVRRRVARSEIAANIATCLGMTFGLAMQKGYAIAGRPFARYPGMGAGLITMDVGCVLAAAAPGEGEVEAGELQGGPAAVAMHAGAYDELPTTFAAIERWVEDNGYRTGGAPWESYLTDPAEHPNPADWRTRVCWPLAS